MSEDKLDRIVALLEGIAARLEASERDRAYCPHGYTGMCMFCVIQNDLLRPKENTR